MFKKAKKLMAMGIVGLGVLVGTSTAAFADTAGWQYNGEDSFVINGEPGVVKSYWGDYHSYNNWLRLKVPPYTPNNNSYNARLQIHLYEYDPTNTDDYIGTFYVDGDNSNGTTIDVDITPYEDGDNNLAEVYAVYEYNFAVSYERTFYWYD